MLYENLLLNLVVVSAIKISTSILHYKLPSYEEINEWVKIYGLKWSICATLACNQTALHYYNPFNCLTLLNLYTLQTKLCIIYV